MKRSRKLYFSFIMFLSPVSALLSPIQNAAAEDFSPITGLYVSSSYEHVPEYQGNRNIYLEWTLRVDSSYWDTYELDDVICTSTEGNCSSKGWYTPLRTPRSGQIRVDSVPENVPFDVQISVITKSKTNPSETTTAEVIHKYRSSDPAFSYTVEAEFIGGGEINVEISAPLRLEGLDYKTWFSCQSPSGASCQVSGNYNLSESKWEGSIQLADYEQGNQIEVTLNRHWATALTDFTVDGTYGTTVRRLTLPTLSIGISPVLGSIVSEPDGCSFSITNFDSNFEYFFKTNDSDVVISNDGKVRIMGQLPGQTFFDYPSSRRPGYTIVNNVSEEFPCTSTISEATRTAEREAVANAAARAAAAKREAEVKSARSEISNKFRSAEKVTIETFKQGEIAGITSENIEAVQAEILALPEASRAEIIQILKIAYKFEIVGKIASDNIKNVRPTDLIRVGLLPEDSKHKASLTFALKKLPSNERSTYGAIKKALDTEIAKIQGRKDRLALAIAGRISRS